VKRDASDNVPRSPTPHRTQAIRRVELGRGSVIWLPRSPATEERMTAANPEEAGAEPSLAYRTQSRLGSSGPGPTVALNAPQHVLTSSHSLAAAGHERPRNLGARQCAAHERLMTRESHRPRATARLERVPAKLSAIAHGLMRDLEHRRRCVGRNDAMPGGNQRLVGRPLLQPSSSTRPFRARTGANTWMIPRSTGGRMETKPEVVHPRQVASIVEDLPWRHRAILTLAAVAAEEHAPHPPSRRSAPE